MKTCRALASVSSCVLFAVSLFAQQAFYSSIIGNVTDASGSFVPGASVTVANVATGVSIDVKTSAQGLYQALNLNTGNYRVTIKAPGFQTFVRENVLLSAGQQARVDAPLQVGTAEQTVEVNAQASMINTENATTSLVGTFVHKNTVTLPSGGTATQVFPDIYYQLRYAHADIQNAAFTIGGSLQGSNAEVQDGMRVEGQRHYVGGNRGLARPGIESAEEVVVTTTNPSAKYPNASAIETVMKSGTNNWHGTAMYIHGERALNAASYYTGVKIPFRLHQYFGSLGGPIRKNKTFFFFGQQGFNYPIGEESFANLPTPKMKGGDFSELLDPAFLRGSAPIQIIDPQTRLPFPNNIIPSNRLDPIATKALQVLPNPNRASDATGPQYNRNYLLSDQFLIRKEKFNFDTRVDHYFSPTQHTYGRFSLFDSPNGRTQSQIPGFGGNYFIIKTKTATLHHTSTFGPNLVNHIMFGIFNEDDPLGPGNFVGLDQARAWNKDLGIAGVPAGQDSGFPWLQWSQSGLTNPLSYSYSSYKNRYTQIRDDVSWSRGKHNIQLGFDVRHESEGSDLPGVGQGAASDCRYGCLNFNGRWTNFDFADYMLGLPFTTTRQFLLPPDERFRNEWGVYFQDDIKWTSKLSTSLGFRYDYYSIVTSENGFESFFDPASRRLVVPSDQALSKVRSEVAVPVPIVSAANAGFQNTLLEPNKHDWGPRVGFAYRLGSNMVVRGGVGVYHTPLTNAGRRLLTGPFSATQTFPAVQPGPNDQPVLQMATPFQVTGLGSALTSFFGGDRNIRDPLHYNFNLAIERQIGANAFSVEYVNKRSILPYTVELNAVPPSTTPFTRSLLPFPTLGSVTGLKNGAHYVHNGVRFNAKRRFTNGLFFDVAYVFAKTIDDLGGSCNQDACGSPENPFNRLRDRGEISYLQPHRVTINYIYEIPFGKKGGRLALPDTGFGHAINYLVRGWEMGGTYNFQTSPPLTVTGTYLNAFGQQFDAPNTNRLGTVSRMNVTGQPLEPTTDQTAQGYVFNPNAFTRLVPTGNFGNEGTGVLRFGAARTGFNQSVFRNFRVPWFIGNEGANFRIGFLFFNVFNHSDLSSPTVNMTSALFGKRATEKTGGDYTGANMRTITVQVRLDF